MNYNDVVIPNHVAIILDGNGRWAKARNLSRSEGHRAGFNNLVSLAEHIFDKGVKVLSVYAFSTENFKRSKEEVDFLMQLLKTQFVQYARKMKEKNIKVLFSGGRKEPLDQNIINIITEAEDMTKECEKGILNICFNYGSHLEIVEACKKIHQDINDGKITINDLNEDLMYQYMFQKLPPIDFLIRTSGEQRLSNFMMYQASYAELYFPNIYFPDFHNQEFDKALIEYAKRDRRFGGINYETENR